MGSVTSIPSVAPQVHRALVVDDEQALARLVAGYLERDGFEVHVAFDGAEGLELARTVDPDVVVLDLGLPGMDGIEVCRGLRTFSDCYVVMLTARAEEIDTLIGLAVGADDYRTGTRSGGFRQAMVPPPASKALPATPTRPISSACWATSPCSRFFTSPASISACCKKPSVSWRRRSFAPRSLQG